MKLRTTLAPAHRRRWLTLLAVTFAQFMGSLDNSVVNVALPTIQKDLGVTVAQLEWVVTGYFLSFAVLMLTGGKLADMYGRRRVFMIGLAVFTVSSLCCGLASSGDTLIAARVMQGVGGALMLPATLSIITATFPPAERGRAIGIWSSISAVAFASGPFIGGVITEHINWSWVFFINIPIGILGLVAAPLAIKESRDTSHEQRLDLPGLVTSTIALFALVYALIEGNALGWTSARILSLLAIAVVFGTMFVFLELRQRLPMLDLTLFRNPTFAAANSLTLISQFAGFGVFFFIALYLQNVLHYSPIEAGAAFLPWSVIVLVASPVAGNASDRIGSRWLTAVGLAVTALALVLFAQLEPGDSYWSVFPAMVAAGLGAGCTVTPIVAAAMSSVPIDKAGVGSGVLNTFRQVGGTLGVAVMGAILASTSAASIAHGASTMDAFIDGLHRAFLAAAVVAAVGAAVAAIAIRTHAPPRTTIAPETLVPTPHD